MGWKLVKAPSRKVNVPSWVRRRHILVEPYQIGVVVGKNFLWYRVSSMAAAIAYRAMFATVPLIMLMMILAMLFRGETLLRKAIEDNGLTGELFIEIAEQVQASGQLPEISAANWFGLLVTLALIIFGISTLFQELVMALDAIWEVEIDTDTKELVVRRLLGFVIVLFLGAVILVSMFAVWLIEWLGNLVGQIFPIAMVLTPLSQWMLSPLLICLLLILMYKLLPNTKIFWKDVWLGSVLATIFIIIGQLIMNWFFTRNVTYTSYGLAGSLMVFILWVYYASMIILLGAVFTREYAYRYGSRTTREQLRGWKQRLFGKGKK